MVCCSAPLCSNSSSKGFRLFRFPSETKRRAVWLFNCRRGKWQPTDTSRLCEVHFTEEQFEQNRQDGRKLLKSNAIPTIFHFPDKPLEESPGRPLPKKRAILGVNHDQENENMMIEENSSLPVETGSNPPEDEVAELKKEIRKLKLQVLKLRKDKEELEQKLGNLFEPDQMLFLQTKGSTNPYSWSEKTIKKAFQIRAVTGKQGYEYLREIGFPLPSYRTLCRRLEATNFAPGLQMDIIEWLGVKISKENDTSKLCVLCIDEMQLRPTMEYDKGLKRYVGFISPEVAKNEEERCQLATHALAFVVRGLTLHWKQVVGYFLTGGSIDGTLFWKVTKQLINILFEAGLTVICISSDMGSNNTRLWNLLGIHSTRFQVSNRIPHPNCSGWLYFMPDVSHLIKNIRNCLLSNDVILPTEVVIKNNLPTNTVKLDHIRDLINIQEGKELRLTPKLNLSHVSPSKFQKMRVEHASSLLSQTTANALNFCAVKGLLDEDVKSTSWFVEKINSWFDLMNSRVEINALNKNDANGKIVKLKEMLDLIKNIEFSRKNVWKPIQTGIQLATQSVICLHEDLVVKGNLQYLLTARLTTDSVENLFSQIRGYGDSHPTAVKFRHNIKLISISQFLTVPRFSSYNCDDDSYYLDVLKRRPDNLLTEDSTDEIEPIEWNFEDDGDILDESALYYVSGWAVHAALKDVACEACIDNVKLKTPFANSPCQWTCMVEKKQLSHPTELVFRMVKLAENIFKKNEANLIKQLNIPQAIMDNIYSNMDDVVLNGIPKCHKILEKVLSKFINLRLHVYAEMVTKKNKYPVAYGSKTAFMRTVSNTC